MCMSVFKHTACMYEWHILYGDVIDMHKRVHMCYMCAYDICPCVYTHVLSCMPVRIIVYVFMQVHAFNAVQTKTSWQMEQL